MFYSCVLFEHVVLLGLSVETIIDFGLGFCVSLGLSHTNLPGE